MFQCEARALIKYGVDNKLFFHKSVILLLTPAEVWLTVRQYAIDRACHVLLETPTALLQARLGVILKILLEYPPRQYRACGYRNKVITQHLSRFCQHNCHHCGESTDLEMY